MKLKSEIRNPKSETSFKYFNFGNFKFVSNFVLSASCLLVLATPLIVSAEGFVPLAGIPGLTQDVTADTAGLAAFFNNLYKFAIGIAAVLAVIMIIWGGLEYSTQDSISKKSDGKERIQMAIFGLILVLSPVLVFSVINPSILNLSINLQKLDTASGGQTAPTARTPNVRTTGGYRPTTSSNTMDQTIIPCDATGSCSAANQRCLANTSSRNAGQADVVCVKSDGTIDPSGRTDSRWNPLSSAACVTGETLAISCTLFGGTTTGTPTP